MDNYERVNQISIFIEALSGKKQTRLFLCLLVNK